MKFDVETLDVDNPLFPDLFDGIEAHSKIADFYGNRPGYAQKFFEIVFQKMELNADSVLLDLCCGRGELAQGFAPLVKNVYAFDGSAEMITNKFAKPNIEYSICDVNSEEISLAKKVDSILIGSSIHWIKKTSLERLISDHLAGSGSVMISHSFIKTENSNFNQALENLNQKFGRRRVKLDILGSQKMRDCGLQKFESALFAVPVKFDLDYLFNYQLSFLYGDFYSQVMNDLAKYKSEFVLALTPFIREGKLEGEFINAATFYHRGGEVS